MALIPPHFLKTTVALGLPASNGSVKYDSTGFLYGYPTGEHNENGNPLYYLYLVTNRHVFEGLSRQHDTCKARLNKTIGSGAHVYDLILKQADGTAIWTVHPDPEVDVAVTSVDADKVNADGIEYYFFEADNHTLNLNKAKEIEVSEGDGVFVLGYPLGEAGNDRNYPIARQGIIARIQDWLQGSKNTFLIDSSIFPGNSGGPVLLKPEPMSISGTKSNSNCLLVGMVSSYIPYREFAVSAQTGQTRMIFEENSGLGIIMPADLIHETVSLAVAKKMSTQSSRA